MTTPLRARDLLLVAGGAAVGALLRHGAEVALPAGTGFPWAVLAVNVVGALALGLLPLLPASRRDHRVAVALGPGLLGGFTTVSTFAGQARDLAVSGRLALAAAYVAVTLAAGLAAATLGRRVSHRPEPEDALT